MPKTTKTEQLYCLILYLPIVAMVMEEMRLQRKHVLSIPWRRFIRKGGKCHNSYLPPTPKSCKHWNPIQIFRLPQPLFWKSSKSLSLISQKLLWVTSSYYKRRKELQESRQHCRLNICMELVELTNSETAAATPPRGGCKIFEEPQLTRKWRLLTFFLANYPSYLYNSEWDGFWDSKFARTPSIVWRKQWK